MNRQARFIVSGRVQGAAYRDNVEKEAYGFPITGTVRNLEDETVEIICEGETKAISEFLKRIRIRRWPIMVENVRVSYRKPTGEFKSFVAIRPEPTARDIIDRLDLGMSYMSDMNSNIGTMDSHVQGISTGVQKMDSHIQGMDTHIQKMDSHIQGMDTHIQKMDSSIQQMDSNMGRHFGKLDQKYDKFGKTMKGMAKDLRKSTKDSRATRTQMNGMASDTKSMKGSMVGMARDIKAIRKTATSRNGKKSGA